jgi:hypothetical protein
MEEETRPKRPVPLRQREEVQEVLFAKGLRTRQGLSAASDPQHRSAKQETARVQLAVVRRRREKQTVLEVRRPA